MKTRWLAGAALSLCLAAPGLAAPLVVNGVFETGDLSGWDGSGIITCSTDPAFAHTGNGSAAFLAFISPSELFQDIATVIGHQYLVEFWALSGAVPFSSTFDATFGTGAVSIDPNLTDSYTRYSFVTTALGSLTRLSFTTNPDPGGSTADTYFLDDVAITDLSAPEVQGVHSTLPLGLAIGLLLLARSRRLRSELPLSSDPCGFAPPKQKRRPRRVAFHRLFVLALADRVFLGPGGVAVGLVAVFEDGRQL